MRSYKACHNPRNRGCWLELRNPREWKQKKYTIETDYDDVNKVPKGIVREVNFC
jgi:hypothetical protein